MRIALVADEDPGWGGIGTYTGVLGAALAELGHDVHLVLRGWEHDGTETLDGLVAHRVTVSEPSWRRGTTAIVSRLYGTRESLIFSRGVAHAVGRIAPDVVEAPEFHAGGLVAALRSRLGFRAPPVVVRLHSPAFLTAMLAGEPRDVDVRVCEALEAVTAQCARLMTAPSRAVAALVRRRWHLPDDRVRVVPNPIDDAVFAPGCRDTERVGSMLVVGRVERAKGQDLLVEALPAIRDRVPEAHVRFVGSDGGATADLQRRAADLGVSDAVAFAGACPRHELPAVYGSAALCVVPSRFEAFPYSALEAMACGRPVVAARVGGLAEVVEDGADGVLVDPENPEALSAAITRLLLDRAARRRLGDGARERARSAYTARGVAARMVDCYSEAAR